MLSYSIYPENIQELAELDSSYNVFKPDIMALYQEELNNRKKLLQNKSDDNELSLDEINFMSNLINLKNKAKLLLTYKNNLSVISSSYDKNIHDLTKAKIEYETFLDSYAYVMNVPFDIEYSDAHKDVISKFSSLLDMNKKEKENIDEKINDILTQLTTINNIIKPDDKPSVINQLCFTCQENNITHCLYPCGHTYCNKCILTVNIENTKCYACRSKIKSIVKLYML